MPGNVMSNNTITAQRVADKAALVMPEKSTFISHTSDFARSYWAEVNKSNGLVRPGLGTLVPGPERALASLRNAARSGQEDTGTDGQDPNRYLSRSDAGNDYAGLVTGGRAGLGVLDPSDFGRTAQFGYSILFNRWAYFAHRLDSFISKWYRDQRLAVEDGCENMGVQIDQDVYTRFRAGGSDAVIWPAVPNAKQPDTNEPGDRPQYITVERIFEVVARLREMGSVNLMSGDLRVFLSPSLANQLSIMHLNLDVTREKHAGTLVDGFMGKIRGLPFVETNRMELHTTGTRLGVSGAGAANVVGFPGTALVPALEYRTNAATGQADVRTAPSDATAVADYLYKQDIQLGHTVAGSINGRTFGQGDHFVIDGVYQVNRDTRNVVGRRKEKVFTVLESATGASGTVSLSIHPRIVTGGAWQNCFVGTGSDSAAQVPTAARVRFIGESNTAYEQVWFSNKRCNILIFDFIHNPGMLLGAQGANVKYGMKGIKSSGQTVQTAMTDEFFSMGALIRADSFYACRSVDGHDMQCVAYVPAS